METEETVKRGSVAGRNLAANDFELFLSYQPVGRPVRLPDRKITAPIFDQLPGLESAEGENMAETPIVAIIGSASSRLAQERAYVPPINDMEGARQAAREIGQQIAEHTSNPLDQSPPPNKSLG